jgi:hypothetical protein
MAANPQYKDTVFRLLFSETSAFREAYDTFEKTPLPKNASMQLNTLDRAAFRDRLNDVSCLIGGKLIVLIEQQSTLNPNMPLRLLEYIVELYENMLGNRAIYSSKRLLLPRPEFIIVYNGSKSCPDEQTLRLSDCFMKAEDLGVEFAEPAPLELTAKMYNINSGHNTEKLRQSKLVAEYSAFTARVREQQEEAAQGRRIRDLSKGEQQQAMAKAVDWCIEHTILKDFLTRHREEVIMMIYQEWDMDTALEVEHEEGRDEGRDEKGHQDALNALSEGLPIPTISRITGLDTQTITQLAATIKQRT